MLVGNDVFIAVDEMMVQSSFAKLFKEITDNLQYGRTPLTEMFLKSKQAEAFVRNEILQVFTRVELAGSDAIRDYQEKYLKTFVNQHIVNPVIMTEEQIKRKLAETGMCEPYLTRYTKEVYKVKQVNLRLSQGQPVYIKM